VSTSTPSWFVVASSRSTSFSPPSSRLPTTLTFTAKVVGKREEGGEKLVDLELATTNQDGVEVLTGTATAAA